MTSQTFPKINLEAIRQFFVSLWHKFRASIKDPKKRKKWFKYGLYSIGTILFLFVFLFLMTWAGLFGPLPNKKTLLSIRQPEASKRNRMVPILYNPYLNHFLRFFGSLMGALNLCHSDTKNCRMASRFIFGKVCEVIMKNQGLH